MSDLLLSLTPPPGVEAPVCSFTASSIAYDSLKRVVDYSWGKQPTIHPVAKPEGSSTSQQCYTKQFGGISSDVITLSGLLYPFHARAGFKRIDRLRWLAGTGKPVSLVVSSDTMARKLGKYVITGITETQSEFTSGSSHDIPIPYTETFVAAQKVDFIVTLSSFSTCNVVGADASGDDSPSRSP